MRLGVVGLMPGHLEQVDTRVVRNIADLGFTGVGMHLSGNPADVTRDSCRQVHTLLADQGVQLVQFWGAYPCIISPDESIRREGVRTAQEIVRVAGDIGALLVGMRPTSLSPDGEWWPHPDNYAPETEARLIKSLREIASACEVHGVPMSLECHVTSTLNSAESIRRIVEATGSSFVKVTVDPVNFVADLYTAYHTTQMINTLFDGLGPYIVDAHVKDFYVESRHIVHLSETIPGDGIFDFDTYFRRFEALLPEGYALIEHLPEAQIPQAKSFVSRKLEELHINVLA